MRISDWSSDVCSSDLARSQTFTCLSLVIPRALLADALRTPDDHHLLALPSFEPMTVLLRDHMLSLKRIGARLTAAQGNALVPATTALVRSEERRVGKG